QIHQTPEPLDSTAGPDAKGRPAGPEKRSHSIALPLTHAHTRLGLARLARLAPGPTGLRSTARLNQRNRIVRSKSDGQRSPNDAVFLRMDEIPYIHEDRPEGGDDKGNKTRKKSYDGGTHFNLEEESSEPPPPPPPRHCRPCRPRRRCRR
ncbi:hypothetical protein CRUP_001029, partial [Coryphaenoides rupestris]